MTVYVSAKGYLCAEENGKNIHSRYNPEIEALRFIRRKVQGNPSTIIILGAGLGYIQKAIKEDFPETRLIPVFYNDILFRNCIHMANINDFWYPSAKMSIHSFFQEAISERDLAGLQIIEWEPSANLFSGLSLSINLALKHTVQQLNGNIQTTALFGRRWLRNLLNNYLHTEQYCLPEFPSMPVVVASSGPTLLSAMSQIKKEREKFLLFALPSSLMALEKEGIIPDLQISTDPGYYGSLHLRHLFPQVILANPLTSCRIIGPVDNPIWILNQNTPFEKDLFSLADIPCTNIPSNGTVSGTALELAANGGNPVFFAGLDFCYSDIQSHIKPHTFDSLIQSEANRIRPIHTLYFQRAAGTVPDFTKGIRTARSLDTYRNWFSLASGSKDFSIKRLKPSPIKIENMGEGFLKNLPCISEKEKIKLQIFTAPGKNERLKVVRNLITLWENKINNGKDKDLFYFIDARNCTTSGDRTHALQFLKGLGKIYGR